MPVYIQAALHKYQHQPHKAPQYSPHAHPKPQYGAKVQMTEEVDTSPILQQPEIKRIQGIVGTLLFYALMVDPTLLVALGAIATAQAKGTKATAKAVQQLLDYCATQPNATLQYHASNMILRIHSDASYLSEPKARSRAGGYFFFGNHIDNLHNGAVLIISTILKMY